MLQVILSCASLKTTTNVIAVPLHPFVGHALGCRFCVISSQPILFKMCTFCTSYYVSKYDKFLLLFLEFFSTAHILSALYLKKAFLQFCSIQIKICSRNYGVSWQTFTVILRLSNSQVLEIENALFHYQFN